MALLDRGNQKCVVTPRVRTKDDTNTSIWTAGTPVTVYHGMLQATSASEDVPPRGKLSENLYKWISRGPWPGGPRSTVECDGRTFEQVGFAMGYSSGQNTTHVSVTLKEVVTEVH